MRDGKYGFPFIGIVEKMKVPPLEITLALIFFICWTWRDRRLSVLFGSKRCFILAVFQYSPICRDLPSGSNHETGKMVGKAATLLSPGMHKQPSAEEKEDSSEEEDTTPISATSVQKLPATSKSTDQPAMKIGAKRSLDLGQGRDVVSLNVDNTMRTTSGTPGVEEINIKKGKTEGR